jgi:uncharacterized protein
MALPELIEALLQPAAYPEPPRRVALMQTQMSFILLGDEFVYKIKKPVNLGYLDYTTLDKRKFLCEQEVRLNRRLCPEAYLTVLPVVRRQGVVMMGGEGNALEYAVKMRRLPPERMMNVLLPQNKVTLNMVAAVAARLAGFHREAETSPVISDFGSLEAIGVNTAENFDQTAKYIGQTITAGQYRKIKDYTAAFMKEKAALFNRRAAAGRIRDCHGDLHAAHICFTDTICIYDCIEFNDRFRYCDVASEVAFLAMDLDHYGRADLSAGFIDAYIEKSGDAELRELLHFYKGYRAYVRGKVACFQLDDPHIPASEKAGILAVARDYFKLAESYTSK